MAIEKPTTTSVENLATTIAHQQPYRPIPTAAATVVIEATSAPAATTAAAMHFSLLGPWAAGVSPARSSVSPSLSTATSKEESVPIVVSRVAVEAK